MHPLCVDPFHLHLYEYGRSFARRRCSRVLRRPNLMLSLYPLDTKWSYAHHLNRAESASHDINANIRVLFVYYTPAEVSNRSYTPHLQWAEVSDKIRSLHNLTKSCECKRSAISYNVQMNTRGPHWTFASNTVLSLLGCKCLLDHALLQVLRSVRYVALSQPSPLVPMVYCHQWSTFTSGLHTQGNLCCPQSRSLL